MQERIKKFIETNRPQLISVAAILVIIIPLLYYFIIFQPQQQEHEKILNLQNQCADQAKILFESVQSAASGMNYTYKSHYSFNLAKCYILIHGIGISGTGISDKLMDVYENKDIANCESYTSAPELDSCIFKGSSAAYNINAFDDFSRVYMEAE